MLRTLLATLAMLSCGSALAQTMPTGDPEQAGFSRAKLDQVMAVLNGEVEAGHIAGAVFAIERHGKVVWSAPVGFRDKAANVRMTTDSLFPLASMTKPIASVVAMTLVEQGKIALRDPLAKYLPAFKDVKVAKTAQGGGQGAPGPIETVPLERPITIQDLFRHTAGLVNGSLFTRTPVRQAYIDAGVYKEPETLAEEVDKIATLPLGYQPGTHWDYSQSVDVLARVAEIASGKPFDRLVADALTGPLAMHDTMYNVPEEDRARVAQPVPLATAGSLPPHQDVTQTTGHFQGNTGLVSTAGDYLRFAQMLLDHGRLGEARILGAGTVDLMRADALGPISRDTESGRYLLGPGYGFGLGFSVRIADGQSAWPGATGDFGWGGAFGTQFLIDPAHDMAAVLMINQLDQFPRIFEMFNTLVYETLAD